MNILIIEDEELAAEGLTRQLKKVKPDATVVAVLDSIKSAVEWIQHQAVPDLAFVDIQLADGLSFEIFEQVKVPFPVVFTTAYDAYALRAFKVNSIDYLLKPVAPEALEKAFDKWDALRGAPVANNASPAIDMAVIQQLLQRTGTGYKTRFMVKVGERLAAFATTDVQYFFGENKTVWMRLQNGRKYVVDYTLDELQELLNPADFYRINRKYLVTFESIKEVVAYTNSRLKLLLKDPADQEDTLISREKAEDFRIWLGK